MKKFFLIYLFCNFGGIDFSVQAVGHSFKTLCAECRAPLGDDFISLYKPDGKIDRLICKKCSRMMKAKKETISASSPSPSAFSLGSDTVFDSPLSSISPLSPTSSISMSSLVECFSPFFVKHKSTSVPAAFFVDEKKAIELAECIVDQKIKKGMRPEGDFFESYGEPTSFDQALGLKIRMFEKLYEASKMSEDDLYICQYHRVEKYADVFDSQGNRQSLTIDAPFFFKRGGVLVFKGDNALQVKDLKNNRSYMFPPETVSMSLLKAKCQDYGFEKVEPLTSYQEADFAYQARIKELPQPSFAK